MKKADKILIVCIMVISCLLVFPLLHSKSSKVYASVIVKQKEVLRIDLSKDDTYSVDGTLGKVIIEVKSGKVRVKQEKSPHHYCSQQGYVDDVNTPIVCLPNETVVTIENDESSEDTVIQ